MSDLSHEFKSDMKESEIQLGRLLSEGGQAKIYRIEGYDRVLYKRFNQRVITKHAIGLLQQLRFLIGFYRQNEEHHQFIEEHFSWPITLTLNEDDSVVGCVIMNAPRIFYATILDVDRPRDFGFLMYQNRAKRAGIPTVSFIGRLTLLLELCDALLWLDDKQLIYEDLAPQNLLWSVDPSAIFIVDCDSLRPNSIQDFNSPLNITRPWSDPRVIEQVISRPDQKATAYSFGLIFRAISPKNGPAIPASDLHHSSSTSALYRLLDRTFQDADSRPTLLEWRDALRDATGTIDSNSRYSTGKITPALEARTGGLAYATKERLAFTAGIALGAFAAYQVIEHTL